MNQGWTIKKTTCQNETRKIETARLRLTFTRPGRAMLLGSSHLQIWWSHFARVSQASSPFASVLQRQYLLFYYLQINLHILSLIQAHIFLNNKSKHIEIMSHNLTSSTVITVFHGHALLDMMMTCLNRCNRKICIFLVVSINQCYTK